ncbi:tRNA (pseudouridine(54)-N(1))-methyltransferase TrmY [[Eubacterium] cellulosolvens]
MRNFIIVGHRALTDPNFSLNDLPGTGGRMDILARCINSAFVLSHGIRTEVEVAVVLLGPENPPKTVRFVGTELKYLNPDERSTGALIRNALVKHSAAKSGHAHQESLRPKATQSTNEPSNEIQASPGVYISNSGLHEILDHYSQRSRIIYLIESAPDISETAVQTNEDNLTFILSDHKNFTDDEDQLIRGYSKAEVSIGPAVLHTEHCIVLIHNYLDRIRQK